MANVVKRDLFKVGEAKTIPLLAKRLNRQIGEIRQFNSVVVPRVASLVKTRTFLPMLEKLGIYPARQLGMRMNWRSDAQRKKVMMILRAKKNVPYRRSMKLRNGWECDVKVNQKTGAISATTQNTATSTDPFTGKVTKYAQFVTGAIGFGTSKTSLKRYQDPIQPFHKDRGWQPSYPIIQKYYKEAEAYCASEYDVWAEKLVKENL